MTNGIISRKSVIFAGLSGMIFLGAARDCRTATVETGGAPIVEAPVTADVTIAALNAKIQELQVRINTVDSWTSIILAASVGLSMLCGIGAVGAYILAHRFRWVRSAIDLAKGKC